MRSKSLSILLCACIGAVMLTACGGKKAEEQPAPAPDPAPVVEETQEPVEEPVEEVVEETVEEVPEVVEEAATTAKAAEPAEPHIYDRAFVAPVMNGPRTEKIGEYSYILADSSECTDEALIDWYNNYIRKNDFNYSFIVYTDMEGYGIFTSSGIVEIGDEIIYDEENDEYNVGDNSQARIVAIYEDGTMQEFSDE